MTTGKDDPRIVKFMAKFQELRNLIDDDPSDLGTLASNDDVLKRLCVEVSDLALSISMNERQKRQLFAAPVDPKFVQAWRRYEDGYSAPLAGVWFGLDPGTDMSIQAQSRQAQWRVADVVATDQAKAIEIALTFAEEQADFGYSDFPEGFPEQIKDAMESWRRLTQQAGLDLRGAFRRRELVPFVLIPRHVSSHHGSGEPVSLLTHLQQAHDAFVFGFHHAALALMRAVLELCLIRHYGAKGNDLEETIDNVRKLPVGVSAGALHRLRKRTNETLHLGRVQGVTMPRDLEQEILSYLYTLRALIEGAPIQRP